MDEPRRRGERKSGSSSRSPSLSRRPSLKDKKSGSLIGKAKMKKSSGTGNKKERWLLTRKTWRYMSDAVGNLLPESHRPAASSAPPPPPASSRVPSNSQDSSDNARPSSSFQPCAGAAPPPPHKLHSSNIPSVSSSAERPTVLATGGAGTSRAGATSGTTTSGSAGASKPTSALSSPAYGGIMSFPSHRPGVTPTGPGPGRSGFSPPLNQQPQALSVDNKFYPPSDDIPTLEQHFEAVCSKESKFLLWRRTKSKGLSGPALRELKLSGDSKETVGKGKGAWKGDSGAGPRRGSAASILEAIQMRLQSGSANLETNKENRQLAPDYYSPTTEEEDEEEYEEYDDLDEEQVTVRERRRSSATSSTTTTTSAMIRMMMAGGGVGGVEGQGWTQGPLSFLRPLSTLSSLGSESSYSVHFSPSGETKIYRNTSTQTEPFPEELLIRLRLERGDGGELGEQQQLSWTTSSGGRPLSAGENDPSSEGTALSQCGMAEEEIGQMGTRAPSSENKLSAGSPQATPQLAFIEGGGEEEEKQAEPAQSPTSARPSITGQDSSSWTSTRKSSGAGTLTDKKSDESGYSSSISDTVMRYLRMVRKNSKADKDKEAIDKFKTVNYDRSLRYIKSKNVTVEEALEHEKNKAQQQQQQLQQQQQQQSQQQDKAEHGKAGLPKAVKGSTSKIKSSEVQGAEADLEKPRPVKTQMVIEGESETVGHEGLEHKPCAGEPRTLVLREGGTIVPEWPDELGERGGASSVLSPAPSATLVSNAGPEFDEARGGGEGGSTTSQQLSSSSVGIQAGESLVLFLRKLEPTRKMSDFSSSCASSTSPAEMFSPRYSFATTGTSSASDTELLCIQQAAAASMMAMAAEKQLGCHPHQPVRSQYFRRSAADMQQTRVSFGERGETLVPVREGAKRRELEQLYFVASPQPKQPHRAAAGYYGGEEEEVGGVSVPLSSSWTGSSEAKSGDTPGIKKCSSFQQMVSFGQELVGGEGGSRRGVMTAAGNNSSSTTSPTTPSSYSLSRLFHYSQAKSARSQESERGEQGSGARGNVGLAATSSPSTPTTSSSSLGGGLMRSFFGSAPFSSTFGLGSKKSSLRKPISTSSLTLTTNTGSDSLSGRRSGLDLPPTTSSSPNLLSLIQSSASSAGTGFTNLFSSRAISSIGSSSISSSRVLPSFYSQSEQRDRHRQQDQLPSSPTEPHSRLSHHQPTSSLSVMQKSKSSSSVLPLYGSSGCVAGATSSGAGSSTSTRAQLRTSPGGSVGGGEASGGAAGSADLGPSPTVPTVPSSTSSRLMAKSKLFKSRSKSSTRGTTTTSCSSGCTWSPQGRCKWKNVGGKLVSLEQSNLLQLSRVERLTLQELALEKLRALNLGVDVKIPKEKMGSGQQKPRRRPYLLKKKALSTGFFESTSRREDGKESLGGGSGLVFGISLGQCVANDRLRRLRKATASCSSAGTSCSEQEAMGSYELRDSENGSRNSPASVFEAMTATTRREDKDESAEECSVPCLVSACIQHLEKYGLHTTGIFRVSTSLKRIRQLREEIDSGKEVVFGEEHSPHDVAALLKEFLRDLPEPLLCRELYQAFLRTQKIRNRKLQLEAVQHLVQLLPVSNRDTLAALLKFFANVVANASETRTVSGELLPGNKMEGYSLATLIAPNILPCMPTEGSVPASMDQNAALTKERRESIDLVNYMISNYSALFEVSPELLHDVYLHLMDTNPEAIEGILRQRCGASDECMEELETTSSVFEESECGEGGEPEELLLPVGGSPTPRLYRRREDILGNAGAGKGGQGDSGSRQDISRQRSRRDAREDVDKGGTEQQQQSGAESEGSTTTRSTSRWFRRSRGGDAKTRTSSDSGSEKVKSSRKRESGLFGSKRASSLDSVNVKESAGMEGTGASHQLRISPSSSCSASPARVELARPLSGSDQSLRVPDHLSRRQSSPLLESSGIITASLKIPVPLPLDDIPFIEDEDDLTQAPSYQLHHHHYRLHQKPKSVQKPEDGPNPGHASLSSQTSRTRCRSMSTDSSLPIKTTSSSTTTTPISSPARHPSSSEVSSPSGFTPPTSPPLYGYRGGGENMEEMTAKILLGSGVAQIEAGLHSSSSTRPTEYTGRQAGATVGSGAESRSAGSTPAVKAKNEKNLVGDSAPLQLKSLSTGRTEGSATSTIIFPTKNESQKESAKASSNRMLGTSGGEKMEATVVRPSPKLRPTSDRGVEIAGQLGESEPSPQLGSAVEPRGRGKETKGANISGLIKSKTADFDKMTSRASPADSELLVGLPQGTHIYSIAPRMRLRSQENVLLKQQFLLRQQQQEQAQALRPSGKADCGGSGGSPVSADRDASAGSKGVATSGSCGGGQLPGRRRIVGSASSSAITGASWGKGSSALHHSQRGRPSRDAEGGVAQTQVPCASTSSVASSNVADASSSIPSSTPQQDCTTSSPSRWKRSEIIASRQQTSPHSPNDPETFV